VSPAPPAPRVVVVATEEAASRWARGIRDGGVPAVACPWSTVAEPLDPLAASVALARRDFDLVFLTSARALRFLAPGSGTGLRAAAVGERTAREARRQGFLVEATGRGGAEALAKRLVRGSPPRRALWLRGETALETGAEALLAAGWAVFEAVSYRTVEVPALSEALARLGTPSAYVVGSPAAARALGRALGPDAFPPPAGGPPVVVVGESTALAARAPGRPEPVVAGSVEVDGILGALRRVLVAP